MAIAVSATDNDDSGELLTSCEDGFNSRKKKMQKIKYSS